MRAKRGGALWYSGVDFTGTDNSAVRSGTSPAIAPGLFLGGSSTYAQTYVAYQGSNGHLKVRAPTNSNDTGLLMAANSSPSIAPSTGGCPHTWTQNTAAAVVAYQGSDTILHYYTFGCKTAQYNTQLGMSSGTSPSIAAFPNDNYEVAFSANAWNGTNYNTLYIAGTLATWSTGLPMATNTSPSFAMQYDGSAWEVAYQGADHYLHVYDPYVGDINKGYPMQPNTSPSMAPMPSGQYEIAFQNSGPGNYLYVLGPVTGNVGWGMNTLSSPSIASYSDGSFEVAMQANTNELYYFGSNFSGRTYGIMAPGSSPSISPDFSKPTGFSVSLVYQYPGFLDTWSNNLSGVTSFVEYAILTNNGPVYYSSGPLSPATSTYKEIGVGLWLASYDTYVNACYGMFCVSSQELSIYVQPTN